MDSAETSILSLSTSDLGGGAENVATSIHRGLAERGWISRMLVGEKNGTDPDVHAMHASPYFDYRTVARHPSVLLQKANLKRDSLLGRESFHYPYTRWLTTLSGLTNPKAILAHNLHGGYFDLRMLPGISSHRPFFWFLHDQWPMTGHCAFSRDCNRWITGCGNCPYLDSPPALSVDGTRKNWKRKNKIYYRSRLHIVVPCRWLERMVKKSVLNQAAIEVSVIPYGIDLENYAPNQHSEQLRAQMGYARHEIIGVFVANKPVTNPYKDFALLQRGLPELEKRLSRSPLPTEHVRLVLVGEKKREEIWRSENITVETAPYSDAGQVSRFLQVADFYFHPAIQEVTPLAIQEAMATALPVVASDVGGVSEMFEDGKEGTLVTDPTPGAWAEALFSIIQNPIQRKDMGASARKRIENQGDKRAMLDRIEALIRDTVDLTESCGAK